MSLVGLILTIVVVGVLLWAIQAFIPMDPRIKTLLSVVVVIVLLVWVLQALGLFGPRIHV